jgi:hypothetical protein
MTPPISQASLAAIASRQTPPFTAAATISITMSQGRCPEAFADEARPWCRDNCIGGWRQIARGSVSAVTFEFEDLTDADLFRLSH